MHGKRFEEVIGRGDFGRGSGGEDLSFFVRFPGFLAPVTYGNLARRVIFLLYSSMQCYAPIVPMMKIPGLCLASFCVILLASAAPASTEDVIVPSGQIAQSRKRGVCWNEADAKDFLALGPGVSWYYTWHFADTQHAPVEAKMTFIPMAWGNREEDLRGLATYLKTHKPPFVLAINEPNLKEQAFIGPKTTAELYRKIRAITDPMEFPLSVRIWRLALRSRTVSRPWAAARESLNLQFFLKKC